MLVVEALLGPLPVGPAAHLGNHQAFRREVTHLVGKLEEAAIVKCGGLSYEETLSPALWRLCGWSYGGVWW